jgi:uncharacterized protein (DUF1800 family)
MQSMRGLCVTTVGLLGLVGCSSSGAPSPAPPLPAAITVTVSGGNSVRLGGAVQLAATVANTTNTAVTWQVNGTTGGSAATGTISATGSYTAPAALPSPNTVTVTAVSQASASASGSQTESVLNPLPVVSSATATGAGPSYLVDVLGGGFVSGSQVQVGGAALATTFVSSTELQATATLAAGTTTVAVNVVNPDPGGSAAPQVTAQVQTLKTTVAQAARLLDQATFGPTLNDIQHVQAAGVNGYLAEQFATPATLLPDIATPAPTVCATNTVPCEQSEWWQTVLTGPDQLRQRVAFALSEIFVVSTNAVDARAVTTFHNTLAKDAFGNFYTLMQDVTLSPAMGAYLNMLNSYKPGVVNGVPQIANENYARELMQLFTTGLFLLNADGTPQLDGGGNPMPTYTEAQVQAFARAYTGWTYANASGTGAPAKFPNAANYTMPMAALESAHDVGAKTLLGGTTLPAGQTAQQDLTGALTNLFNHPNVGPFVCRQLIQHLVASQPSGAYVARVSAVFADNGAAGGHKRGDLKAVVNAILMDADARAADTSPSFDGGHLREAMLYMTGVLRGLGATNNDAVAGKDVVANASYNSAGNYTQALGERPYASSSVFNFFPPDYVIPGTTANAPEFGQENTANVVLRLSLANSVVYNGIGGFTIDLSKTSPLGLMASKTGNAVTDSGNLVDALGTIFLHGQMPATMRSALVNHVATLTDPAQRARVATYLVITSSLYKIEH